MGLIIKRILIVTSLLFLGLIMIAAFFYRDYIQDRTLILRNCFAPITLVSTEQTQKIGLYRKPTDLIEEITSEHIENYRYPLQITKTDSEILEILTNNLTERSKFYRGTFPIGPNEYEVCISDDVCGTYQLERPRYPPIGANMLPVGTTLKLDGVVNLSQESMEASRSITFRGRINSTGVWLDYYSARSFAEDNPNVLKHLGIMDKSGRVNRIISDWRCKNGLGWVTDMIVYHEVLFYYVRDVLK